MRTSDSPYLLAYGSVSVGSSPEVLLLPFTKLKVAGAVGPDECMSCTQDSPNTRCKIPFFANTCLLDGTVLDRTSIFLSRSCWGLAVYRRSVLGRFTYILPIAAASVQVLLVARLFDVVAPSWSQLDVVETTILASCAEIRVHHEEKRVNPSKFIQ